MGDRAADPVLIALDPSCIGRPPVRATWRGFASVSGMHYGTPGPLEVRRERGPLHMAGAKPCAVLGMLLVHRDELMRSAPLVGRRDVQSARSSRPGGRRGTLAAAISMAPYATLADVYAWLVPESLLTPEGVVRTFEDVIGTLDPSTPVLDCAAGRGELAVGLRLRGFEVVASDASAAMIKQSKRLAAQHEVQLRAVTCRWDQLVDQGWSRQFGAVFCVGNSLTHADGRRGRQTALQQMATMLRDAGQLILASRNWELVRAQGSGLQLPEQLVERDGRRGLVIHAWTIAESWDSPHYLDLAVVLLGNESRVTSHSERLTFWPFRHEVLEMDLHAAGLAVTSSTYAREAERYRIIARSPGGAPR
jgi:2-polyprenyl-3-methyl-5-hydroxy-6-metoxy-1,4-benzoquinol methylase